LTLDKLFDNYYYQAHKLDIDTLKIYVLQFYNSFVAANPFVRISRQSTSCRNRTITETYRRTQISLDEMNERYDNAFWVRFYTFLRATENNADLEQVQFDRIVRKAQDYEKYISLEKAVDFINQTFLLKDARFWARESIDLSSRVFSSTNRAGSFRF
jgi:hypothetical protein